MIIGWWSVFLQSTMLCVPSQLASTLLTMSTHCHLFRCVSEWNVKKRNIAEKFDPPHIIERPWIILFGCVNRRLPFDFPGEFHYLNGVVTISSNYRSISDFSLDFHSRIWLRCRCDVQRAQKQQSWEIGECECGRSCHLLGTTHHPYDLFFFLLRRWLVGIQNGVCWTTQSTISMQSIKCDETIIRTIRILSVVLFAVCLLNTLFAAFCWLIGLCRRWSGPHLMRLV